MKRRVAHSIVFAAIPVSARGQDANDAKVASERSMRRHSEVSNGSALYSVNVLHL